MAKVAKAKTPESRKSAHDSFDEAERKADRLAAGEPVDGEEVVSGEAFSKAEEVAQSSNKYANISYDNSDYTEADYDAQAREAARVEDVFGFKYNYEFMTGNEQFSDSLREQQAQNQTTGNKAMRGLARLGGEFLLNVLETPGILYGAGEAMASGDIDDMTKNAWSGAIDGLKDALHNSAEVYVRDYVTNGGVADKMLSSDWWATEGASAGAFMAAALVPGMAVSKIGKAASIARVASKSGKWAGKAVKWGDRMAVKMGAAAPLELRQTGQAASAFNQLVTTTAVNTVYEAGIEARGTQLAFENKLHKQYEAGDISYQEMDDAIKSSKTAGNAAFWANVLILAVPNMVMSKAMLGPRGASINKVHGNMHLKAGKFVKGAKPVGAAAKSTLSKVADNGLVKGVGNIGKKFASNTLREGVWEEGAQMTAEKYLTHNYLDEVLDGSEPATLTRISEIASTYGDVLGSTEGQVAALTGGIMGSSMSLYSGYKEGVQQRKELTSLVASYNSGLTMNSVLRRGLYKTDADGNPIFKKDANGKVTNELEMDEQKVAQLSSSKDTLDKLRHKSHVARTEGNDDLADVIDARIQAMAFLPFLENGKEGIDMLEEALKEDPQLPEVIAALNKINEEQITEEQYISEEVDNAKSLLNDMKFYDRSISFPTSYTWDSKNIPNSGLTNEEVDFHRELFLSSSKEGYVQNKAMVAEIHRQLQKNQDEIEKAEKRGAHANIISKLENKKTELELDLKDVDKAVNVMEDSKEFETSWQHYFDTIAMMKKATKPGNSDYLDDIIKSVREASTEEEISAIIKAAKDDGLILEDLGALQLPGSVISMAQSEDILEAFAAHEIIRQHKGIGISDLQDVANDTLLGLKEGAEAIFNATVDAVRSSIEKSLKEQENIVKLREVVAKLTAKVEELSSSEQSSKVTKAELLKLQKEINKELIKANRELYKSEQRSVALASEVLSYSTVIKSLISSSYNEATRRAWSNLVAGDMLYESVAVLNRTPGNLTNLLKAVTNHKDAFLKDLEGTKSAVHAMALFDVNVQQMMVIRSSVDALSKLQSWTELLLHKLEQDSKEASAEDRVKMAALELDLQKQVEEIKKAVLEMEHQGNKLNDKLDIEKIENSTEVIMAERIIEDMKDILKGKGTKGGNVNLSASEVIDNINELVAEFNQSGTVEIKEFAKALNDINKLSSKIGYAKEYIEHLTATRKIDGGVMLTHDQFVKNKTEGDEKSDEELLIAAITSLSFSIPTGYKATGSGMFGIVYDSMFDPNGRGTLALIIKGAIDILKKNPNDVNSIAVIGAFQSMHDSAAVDSLIISLMADITSDENVVKEANEVASKAFSDYFKKVDNSKAEFKTKKKKKAEKKAAKSLTEIISDFIKGVKFGAAKDIFVKNTVADGKLALNLYKRQFESVVPRIVAAIAAVRTNPLDVNTLSTLYFMGLLEEGKGTSFNDLMNKGLGDIKLTDATKQKAMALANERFSKVHFKKKKKEAVPTVNNLPFEVQKAVQDFINSIIKAQQGKNDRVAVNAKIKAFKELIADKQKLMTDLLINDKVVVPGNRVMWTDNGTMQEGTVEMIIDNAQGQPNILIKKDDGTFVIISSVGVTKRNVTVEEENSNNDKKVKRSDEALMGATEIKLPVMDNSHRTQSKKKETTARDGKGGIRKTANEILSYLLRPRNKSKDKVSFVVPKSNLKKLISGATKLGNEELANKYRETEKIFNSLLEGVIPNDKDIDRAMELLTDYLPISVKITEDGKNGSSANTILADKAQLGNAYAAVNREYREAIVNAMLLKAKMGALKLITNKAGASTGVIDGIEAKISRVDHGLLNTEESGKRNKLTDLLGVTLDNIKLTLVKSFNKGINNQGTEVALHDKIESNAGGVYINLVDNTGSTRSVRLNIPTLKGSKELDVIMKVLKYVVGSKINPARKISEVLEGEEFTELTGMYPLLFDMLGKKYGDDLTFANVLDNLLVEGTKTSSLYTTYNTGDFRFGKEIYSMERFNESEDSIKVDLSNKLRAVNFKTTANDNKNVLNISDKDYLVYIIDSKGLESNLKANEPLFVGRVEVTNRAKIDEVNRINKETAKRDPNEALLPVPKPLAYYVGVNVNLNKDDIKLTGNVTGGKKVKPTKKTVEVAKPITPEDNGKGTTTVESPKKRGRSKRVKLQADVHDQLQRIFKANGKTFSLKDTSDEARKLLNKGAKSVSQFLDDFNHTVRASEEADSTKNNKC